MKISEICIHNTQWGEVITVEENGRKVCYVERNMTEKPMFNMLREKFFKSVSTDEYYKDIYCKKTHLKSILSDLNHLSGTLVQL